MAGVESGSTAFDVEETDTTSQPSQEATAGDTGPFMGEYFEGRQTQLLLFSQAAENLSQFDPPTGVSGPNWDRSPLTAQSEDLFTGVSVSGTVLQANDEPLSGQVSIIIGDPEQTTTLEWGDETVTVAGVVAVKDITGSFSVSGAPPAAIFAGSDGDTVFQTISVVFAPHTPGVSISEEFKTFRADIGTHQYGAAYGKVVDHEGNPVGGVGVDAPGTGANTGSDGKFRLDGPSGESINIVTLYGTLEDSLGFTLDADPDNPQVFEFPALSIEVVDAEYEPIASVPVTVDGETYYTDETGELTLSPVGLGQYDITVMEKFEGMVELTQQGTNYEFRFGPDSTLVDWEPDPKEGIGGIKLTALDRDSGVQIRGVAATIPEQGVLSESGEDGVVKLLTEEVGTGEATVQLASGDRRYAPSEVTVEEMPEGEMVTTEVTLQRKEQVVNT